MFSLGSSTIFNNALSQKLFIPLKFWFCRDRGLALPIIALNNHDVHVFEKNATAGGRARSFSEKGYKFDMGPSWYWMPDVFEEFFSIFGKCSYLR